MCRERLICERRARKIKKDVVEELFAKYYHPLLLYALSLCHNVHLAEDIVSTAFFRALQTADDTVEDFKAWLYAVCRNEYFSYCRRKKRVEQTALYADVPDEEDVLQRILRDEAYRALYHAITLLTSEQREVILLFYFADQPIRAIADIMQKSEGGIRVLLHRARARLKEILEEKL